VGRVQPRRTQGGKKEEIGGKEREIELAFENKIAVAAPIPPLAPVTRTVLFWSRVVLKRELDMVRWDTRRKEEEERLQGRKEKRDLALSINVGS